MSTAEHIVNAARVDLLAGVVEERNRLAGAVTLTDTVFPFAFDLRGIREGVVVEVGAELLYVWSVDQATNQATVERGFAGSVASAHDSATIAVVKPRFPTHILFQYLNEDVLSLGSPSNGLYQIAATDVVYNGQDREIAIPGVSDLVGVHEIRARSDAADWPEVRNWRLQRNSSADDFGGTVTVRFDEIVPASTLRVIYKRSFRPLSALTDDVPAVTGVPVSCEDILRMGVQMRAMVTREPKRSFMESQGDTRRPEEVPNGASSSSWRGIAAMRQQRVVEEATKLQARYPKVVRRK